MLKRTALVLAFTLAAGAAQAVDPVELSVTIKNHVFQPAELSFPSGTPVVIHVTNKDATPEEFESGDLGFEKVIPGGAEGVVWVAPMQPGEYTFFGEFNPATAQGKATVK